jgi:hypothetical protein
VDLFRVRAVGNCVITTTTGIFPPQSPRSLDILGVLERIGRNLPVPGCSSGLGGQRHWKSSVSAVGPTLQLAASTPTTAQLFYAKDINPTTLGDQITVTYSCPYSPEPPPTGNPACTTTPSITLAGVVVAEYGGADQNYPQDSVSAGYSTSTSYS